MAQGIPTEFNYARRRPEKTVLYRLIQENWLTFTSNAAETGHDIPNFVTKEFEGFITCGILAHGFCRVHCDSCLQDRLVAWSCKGRGFCPSCMGRRMAEMQVHLSERVLGDTPIRQWVLTVPKPIRYLLAYHRNACSAVLKIFINTVFRWLKTRAKREFALASIRNVYPGAITAIQRHGSAADLNIHYHSLVTDGVFVTQDDTDSPTFRMLHAPSEPDLAAISWEICRNTIAWLRKHDLWIDSADSASVLAQESPLVAACAAASLQGRVLFGKRQGSGLLRLQNPLLVQQPTSQLAGHGFHLHAAVRAAAQDHKAKATLCRYIVRPPIANDRLSILPHGRVQLRLKRAYSDGTTHMLFEPLDFIARLVALVPPPRAHQVRFHGVFAPHHRLRERVVPPPVLESLPAKSPLPTSFTTTRRKSFAMLLKKTFDLDLLICPRCGGQSRVLEATTEPKAIQKILAHLGFSTEAPRFAKARAPPDEASVDTYDAA